MAHRKYKSVKRRRVGIYRKPIYTRTKLTQEIKKIAKDTVMKEAETIKSCLTITDGQQIQHNNYISLSDNLLECTQGDSNPDASGLNNRKGDAISLRGVSLKFMIELNERYSDVTFRLIIVKCARGDTPTFSTMFNGLSANKMLDTFNTDRYTILYSRYYKLKSPGFGTWGSEEQTGAGAYEAADATNYAHNVTISRATKICKVWIPGKKFSRNGIIQYNNASSNPKFFDYRAVLYAYSNYSTTSTVPLVWNIARLNDVVKVMYFKDT